MDSFEFWDQALAEKRDYITHLGGNVYASVQANSICVDNRQCWFPKNRTEVVSTRKGICLKPTEYGKVKNTACVIGDFVPELISVVPCPYRSDHMNQLGFLKCPECNPDHCTEW